MQREFLRALGLRIRTTRESRDLSQRELGERCGWENPQGRVSNYELGKREPPLADLLIIAGALDCDVAQLVFGIPRVSPKHIKLIAAYDKGNELQKMIFDQHCEAILSSHTIEQRKNNRLRKR